MIDPKLAQRASRHKAMKILLTTHQFLPEYTSGTEVLSFEVARELVRAGHEVRILTGWPSNEGALTSEADVAYSYEGISVHRIRSPAFATTTVAERTHAEFDNPAAAAALSAIVEVWRPDLVHCFHLSRLSVSIPLRSAQHGIACVFTPTDFWTICPLNQLRLPNGETCAGPAADSANCVLHLAVQGRRAYLAPLFRWVPHPLVGAILKFAPREAAGRSYLNAARALQLRPAVMRQMLNVVDRIVAPTSYMAHRLREFGAPPESIVELGYGIDTRLYADPRPILTEDRVRLGFIGTLNEHKGAHVLIDAIKLVRSTQPFTVSIYGDETFYPQYVERLKTSANHDARIRFCGTFDRTRLAHVMNEFDALVVPSTWSENTPLVIFAAQAASRPVIGSDVAGIAEVVTDGVNGRLFKAGDAPALAVVLEDLLESPSLLHKMSQDAEPAKDIRTYVAALLDLYQEVLAERHAAVVEPRAQRHLMTTP